MEIKSLASKPTWFIANPAALHTYLLFIGFALALIVRVMIGGAGVAYSPVAGLIFATLLAGLCAAYGLLASVTWKVVLTGVGGAALLLVVPSIEKAIGSTGIYPTGHYAGWALTIICVSLAEEAFLRGVFFDAVTKWRGEKAAVIAAAILFTLLHIPLYGWHIVPLDFTVGLWLGMLRLISGSWIAPGIAHTLADLLSWWLI